MSLSVEIFKTSIGDEHEAEGVIERLTSSYPDARINMDLQDCDKILRISGDFLVTDIEQQVQAMGFSCEVLE